MKQLLITFTLLFSSVFAFSQQIIFEKEIKMKSVFKDKRESMPAVDEETGNTALFLLDNVDIVCSQFNSSFELENSFVVERPTGSMKELQGYSYKGGTHHLFFSNSGRKEFLVQSIDIAGKKVYNHPKVLKLKKELFLESFTKNNKFYILSVQNNSSILKFYVFEGGILSDTKVVNLSKHKFASGDSFYDLFSVLSETGAYLKMYPNLMKVDSDDPVSLEIASKKHKLYYKNDQLYITIDNTEDRTRLITISLDDFSYTYRLFRQGDVDCGDLTTQTNSYLHNDILYQLKTCSKELFFSTLSLDSGKIISSYRVKKDEPIAFKNGAMIQEGGVYTDATRDLTKTKQVLRKMASSDVGVSVYQRSGDLELTIGSFKEIVHNNAGMGVGGVGMAMPVGMVTMSISYNPTMAGYSQYTTTKSVYFKSLFDKETYLHKEGKVTKNAFDKIHDYEDDKDSWVSKTIFRYGAGYIFGYYDKSANKYYLAKFRD